MKDSTNSPLNSQDLQPVVIPDRPIAFNRDFVRLGIGITGALMLSQAVYWQRRCQSEDGWWWKTHEEWEEETGLTKWELITAQKRLVEKGYLHVKRKGVPARNFYQVDLHKVANDLLLVIPTSSSRKSQLLEVGNPNYFYIETTTETTTDKNINITAPHGAAKPKVNNQQRKRKKPQRKATTTNPNEPISYTSAVRELCSRLNSDKPQERYAALVGWYLWYRNCSLRRIIRTKGALHAAIRQNIAAAKELLDAFDLRTIFRGLTWCYDHIEQRGRDWHLGMVKKAILEHPSQLPEYEVWRCDVLPHDDNPFSCA